jgi:DNA-binding transcriptional ArsR family regulator
MLAEKSLSAGEIGSAFEISAPALSRHLRILRRSGLVEDERDEGDNRLRIFKLRLSPLSELGDWLKQVDDFWHVQLLAFKQYAEGTKGDKNAGDKK